MGNTVSNSFSITQIWLDSNDRTRQKWLNAATTDSVLKDLTSNLYEGSFGLGPIPAVCKDAGCTDYIKYVFDKQAVVDSTDGKKYWTEREFREFLQNRFKGLKALEPSVPILWRCFLFHGYFPFVQESQKRIDCDGFLRAVAFIAADGTARLGDDAIGAIIDTKRDRASDNLWRMFRSLAIPSKVSREKSGLEEGDKCLPQTDDLLDILALVQPANGAIMTVPREDLKVHANRILDLSESYEYKCISRGELQALIKLLLSLELDEPEWGTVFNTAHSNATLEEEQLERLANSILSQFVSEEGGKIDWPSFKRALSICLPHITSQFTLIFTSFLVPATESPNPDSLDPSPKTTILSPCIAQYFSLLNPPYQPNASTIRGHDHFEQSKVHFSLQNSPKPIYSSKSTSTSKSLKSAVAGVKSQTLLLLTGRHLKSDTSKGRVTMAVCMSSPWDQPEYRIGTAHGIFQLEPTLEILRPANSQAQTKDLIVLNSETLSFGKEGTSGLVIDFKRGSAILRARSQDTVAGVGYIDIGTTDGRDDAHNDWGTSMEIESLEVFELEGTVSDFIQEEQRQRALEAKIQGWAPNSTEKAVSKDELSKRIQGFGSTG